MLIVGCQWLRSLLLWDATQERAGLSVSIVTVVGKWGGGVCGGVMCIEEWGRDCRRGRGGGWLLWSVRCKVTMQSGGGVSEMCVYMYECACVRGEYYGMPAPWSLCVCAREEEKEETASCAHAATKNTEIYLNYMYTATIGNKTASKCSISGKLSVECFFFFWSLELWVCQL